MGAADGCTVKPEALDKLFAPFLGRHMVQTVKVAFYWVAKRIGLFSVSRWITRNGIRILCYHGVWFGNGHYGNYIFMSPSKFDERMKILSRSGYPVIPLDEALEKSKSNSAPNCATVITIDDGWYSTYRYMVPTLQREGLPATIYVTTYYAEKQWPVLNVLVRYMIESTAARTIDLSEFGVGASATFELARTDQRQAATEQIIHLLDKQKKEERQNFCRRLGQILQIDYDEIAKTRLFHLMSLEEVKEVVENGFDIQLHTHRHPDTLIDNEVTEKEITDNRKYLEPITGTTLKHLCYPNGRYDAKIWPALERLGIRSATTTEPGLNYSSTPSYGLYRILDGHCVHQLEFEAELSGFAALLRQTIRSVRRSGASRTVPLQ